VSKALDQAVQRIVDEVIADLPEPAAAGPTPGDPR
jgi:hypothetical protein